MMTCRHCRHLQDAFLDGELSESQTAEVHAHLLQCAECQREFELVRACAHVIASDDSDGARLAVNFAQRVLDSLPAERFAPTTSRQRWLRFRRWMEYGLAPAAAAVLAFAVLIAPPNSTFTGTSGELTRSNENNRGLVLGESSRITDALFAPEVNSAIDDSLDELGHVATRMKTFCRRTLETAVEELDLSAADKPVASPQVSDHADEDDFVIELMRPFFDLFNPPVTVPSHDEDIERF